MWALGVAYFTILFGKPPYDLNSENALAQFNVDQVLKQVNSEEVSKCSVDVLRSLLNKNPQQRRTTSEKLYRFFKTNLLHIRKVSFQGAAYYFQMTKENVLGSGNLGSATLSIKFRIKEASYQKAQNERGFIPVSYQCKRNNEWDTFRHRKANKNTVHRNHSGIFDLYLYE